MLAMDFPISWIHPTNEVAKSAEKKKSSLWVYDAGVCGSLLQAVGPDEPRSRRTSQGHSGDPMEQCSEAIRHGKSILKCILVHLNMMIWLSLTQG